MNHVNQMSVCCFRNYLFLCLANQILITNVLFVFFPHLIVLGSFADGGGGAKRFTDQSSPINRS